MKWKLLALDIDGTIRNRENIITDRTKELIIKLQKQGITVAIASGRPVYGMQETARELQLDQYGGYILAFNGAVIKNCKTEMIVSDCKLPLNQITEFLAFAKEMDCDMLTYDGENIVTNNMENPYICHEARVNKMNLLYTNFEKYNKISLNKCMIAGNPENIQKAEQKGKERWKNQIDIYRSEPFFLEVMPMGTDKGSSVKRLAEMLGYSRENTVACGDGYNDITMLRYAGIGIAMENAQQDVKDAADYVTASCDEDGVVQALKKICGESKEVCIHEETDHDFW